MLTLCEIASVSGKTLDGCLSGFHHGSFQVLLSVIIFSLERRGLCCAWHNRPWRWKPERNVKCHQKLRGKDAVSGSTVILMPGFGTDRVCDTPQLQGMVVKSLALYQLSPSKSPPHSLSRNPPSWLQISHWASASHLAAFRASFIIVWLPRMSGICPYHKTSDPLCKIQY